MRHATLLLCALQCAASSAQISCDPLPIAYDPGSAVFTEGEISFGDSAIVIDVTNTSTTPMAYPQLKLVPITPLPAGMVMNTHWATFASSWNPGETMPASIFFDVNEPLAPNASVIFEVWANNLTPLLTGDSCRFDAPLNINLDPSALGLAELGADHIRVWPQPADDLLNIRLPAQASGRLVMTDATGHEVVNRPVAGTMNVLSLDDLGPGYYVLSYWAGADLVASRVVSLAR